MGRRGRPRHPDILTPREWEVLELLRARLSNEQIAERLGISLDGAKYHVSQILSKLGVATREEAAALAAGKRPRWLAQWPVWARIAGAATSVAAVAGVALLAWGVLRAGEGSVKLPETERSALVEAAKNAVLRPGMVFHAESAHGSELWIDGDRQLFRQKRGKEGEEGFVVRVGDGWKITRLDESTQQLTTIDTAPRNSPPANAYAPVFNWLQPLARLASAQDIVRVGTKIQDGRELNVFEATTVVKTEGAPEGFPFRTRVEVDADSYLIWAYEAEFPGDVDRQFEGDDTRVEYRTMEFVDSAQLPREFFSSEVVRSSIVTAERRIQKIEALGIPVYWFGEQIGSQGGALSILDPRSNISVDESQREGSIFYRFRAGNVAPGGVTISLRPIGTPSFGPPDIPRVSDKPEQEESVTVEGRSATLYTSLLKAEGIACPARPSCDAPDAPLYRRLVITFDDAVVQLQAEVGPINNPFSDRGALLALAEALRPAERSSPPSPTP
jgi:DNA-binding CsgD family transcriptional regulator